MLLERRLVHVIATDAHSACYRPPILSKGVEEAANILGGYNEAERMVQDIPHALIRGDIPEIPEPV
jgi:protein-tyrosine phosphatase